MGVSAPSRQDLSRDGLAPVHRAGASLRYTGTKLAFRFSQPCFAVEDLGLAAREASARDGAGCGAPAGGADRTPELGGESQEGRGGEAAAGQGPDARARTGLPRIHFLSPQRAGEGKPPARLRQSLGKELGRNRARPGRSGRRGGRVGEARGNPPGHPRSDPESSSRLPCPPARYSRPCIPFKGWGCSGVGGGQGGWRRLQLSFAWGDRRVEAQGHFFAGSPWRRLAFWTLDALM